MAIFGYSALGYEGALVTIEVVIRRGLPGTDIVGLPGGAVRESRERVRAAIRNSGLEYPLDRVLVNLAPAGVRKEGAGFDLAIAAAILEAAGQLHPGSDESVLIMGELQLDGTVRPVPGVLSAVAAGTAAGVSRFIVPGGNAREARALETGCVRAVSSLHELQEAMTGSACSQGEPENQCALEDVGLPDAGSGPRDAPGGPSGMDFKALKGQPILKRALEVAAAGRHNVLVVGPPGSGKTMAAYMFPGILGPLDREDAIAVTRIHSVAGMLASDSGLIRRPPFRAPHHSASREGMIGGGRRLRPGEVSLAHRGVLFLDEASQFRQHVLQGLREPVEAGKVRIARADGNFWFPADFQLLLATNPCPCGNMGARGKVCVCSMRSLEGYWRRLSGPLLDRVDVRVRVDPPEPDALLGTATDSTPEIRDRVKGAVERQLRRYRGEEFVQNGRVPADHLGRYCALEGPALRAFRDAARTLSLSARACASVRRVARTVADLAGACGIREEHVLEAAHYRRDGEVPGFAP